MSTVTAQPRAPKLQGYKGGSQTPKTATEAPDSLVSTQQARIVDLISEGEIYGLVDGVNSIFLDEAPGSMYPSLAWDYRRGTQDQSYLQGFPNVESETTVNVVLSFDTPHIRAIANTSVSAVRINFALGRFATQDAATGDTNGARVEFSVDVASGFEDFVNVYNSAFDGKTASGYTRSVRVDLPRPVPVNGWRLRVRRTTPDSISGNVSDVVNIASVTELIDYKFRYPNSAVMGVSFDAEVFGGAIPKRSYHIKGRIVSVPANYDPDTRTYTGIWNGDFKPAWTNNPAWVYYDLLLNPRFGLGDRLDATQVDKWGLYEIARYCDELVDDGKGGKEPRFTCNLYLQKQAAALKVMQDLAAVFRGITYWGLGQAMVSADLPKDPVYTYTNGNVRGGRFNRKGAKKSTIYTAILSAWNDPNDFYRTKYEYVQDDALVAKFGIRSTTLANIGCCSQGQAHRAAKWALLSNQYDTNTITFGVGLEGIRAIPGQIVRIADQHRQGRRVGGRVRVGSTTTSILLDQLPGSAVAPGDELTVNLPSGESETRPVASVDPQTGAVVPATPFSDVPVKGGVWAYETLELKTELYRIMAISEGENPLDYNITALTYTEGKHSAVDFGTLISRRPTVSVPLGVVPAPENVQMSTTYKLSQGQAVSTLQISWDKVDVAVKYDVEWQRNSGGWIYAGRVSTTDVDVLGIYAGDYRVRVRAMNATNLLSPWTEIGPQPLQGKTGSPPLPVNVRTTSEIFAIRVDWGFPAGAEDTSYSEIRIADSNLGANETSLGMFAYPTTTYTHSGMAAAVTKFFSIRLVDKSGNIGPWSDRVRGLSSDDASDILDYIAGQITETELGQDLLAKIELIPDLQNQIDALDGLQAYKPGETYVKGELVVADGRIYQADKAVPANTPPPNTNFWTDVGSLLETANGFAAQIATNTTSITELNGIVVAQASSTETLRAAYRDDNGEGDLADALDGVRSAANIANEAFVRATENEATARVVERIDAAVANNSAQVVSLREVVVTNQSSTATAIQQVNASVADVSSTVADVSGKTNQNTSAIQQNTAAIQQTATAYADTSGKLSTMWSVKMQVNQSGQYVAAGVGLGIENTGAGLQSQFLVSADRFAIVNTLAGGAITVPFAVQNGQVFLRSAVIEDGSIANAKIGNIIQSNDFVENTSGWQLDKAGNLKFNGAGVGYRLRLSNQGFYLTDTTTGVVVVELGVLS